MDLTTIEANKNVVVYNTFTILGSTFTANMNSVLFTPDYVIVRSINYTPGALDVEGVYTVFSDVISDTIGSFVLNDGPLFVSSPQSAIFKLGRPVHGTMTFMVELGHGFPAQMDGTIAIHLDFVKLKAEKPQLVR